jgi:hypothetical protein
MYASAFDFYSLLNLLALQQSPSIPDIHTKSQDTCKEKALGNPRGIASSTSRNLLAHATKFILHKEWCKQNFVSFSLEKRLVFRATIKPAYQGRISILLNRTVLHFVVPLRKGVVKTYAKNSSNQRSSPPASVAGKGHLLLLDLPLLCANFSGLVSAL